MVRELVEHIVKQLAQDLDKIEIVIREGDESKQVVEIAVSDRDRGRLIGRRGQTIKALRLLMTVVIPEGKKVFVSIVE